MKNILLGHVWGEGVKIILGVMLQTYNFFATYIKAQSTDVAIQIPRAVKTINIRGLPDPDFFKIGF